MVIESAGVRHELQVMVDPLTPRYLAMCLAVWPSAFIPLAVATCSASATLRERPNLVPLAREAAFQSVGVSRLRVDNLRQVVVGATPGAAACGFVRS